MEADCDLINRLVPIPENHPLYSNQCHHQERAIIARVIRWIACDCDKKDDTQYKGLLSFRWRLSSGILLRWCTVKVREHRSDLVKPLFLPGRRHCWLHLVQRQSALSFTDNAISRQFFWIPFGFCHNVKLISIGRSLLLLSLRSHQVKECCKFAQYSISLNAFLTIIPRLSHLRAIAI
jgi:hypothetical protein